MTRKIYHNHRVRHVVRISNTAIETKLQHKKLLFWHDVYPWHNVIFEMRPDPAPIPDNYHSDKVMIHINPSVYHFGGITGSGYLEV